MTYTCAPCAYLDYLCKPFPSKFSCTITLARLGGVGSGVDAAVGCSPCWVRVAPPGFADSAEPRSVLRPVCTAPRGGGGLGCWTFRLRRRARCRPTMLWALEGNKESVNEQRTPRPAPHASAAVRGDRRPLFALVGICPSCRRPRPSIAARPRRTHASLSRMRTSPWMSHWAA